MGVASRIELGCSYELGSGWIRIGVLTRPRWGLGMVMTDAQAFYNMGNPDNAEWLINKITAHRWMGNMIKFLISWNLGDSTWELHTHCKDLEALDEYLELHGAQSVQRLPKGSRRMHSVHD